MFKVLFVLLCCGILMNSLGLGKSSRSGRR